MYFSKQFLSLVAMIFDTPGILLLCYIQVNINSAVDEVQILSDNMRITF